MTIVGEHDYRGARPPDRAARGSSSSEIEAVLSHPQPLAQCARFLREKLPGVERRSVSSTAAAVRMVERVRAALGGARRRAPRPSSTAARSCAKGSRTRPTTSPASSGSPPRGPRPSGGGRVEDLAGLLRARRGPPGRPGRGAAASSPSRGDQPDPDRVAAAAPAASAATCSSATSRAREGDAAGRRGDRGAARQGRIGAGPRLLPGRASCPGASPRCRLRPAYNLAAHGTGSGAQCDLRADQRLHVATRRCAAPEGKGRAARAPRRAPSTPST